MSENIDKLIVQGQIYTVGEKLINGHLYKRIQINVGKNPIKGNTEHKDITGKTVVDLINRINYEFRINCYRFLEGDILFETAADSYYESFKQIWKPSTQLKYDRLHSKIQNYLQGYSLWQCDASILSECIKAYSHSKSMQKICHSYLKKMFDYFEKLQYIKVNPMIYVKTVKLPRPDIQILTLKEYNILLYDEIYLKYINIIRFLLLSGARSSEALGLSWEDVDFENKVIHIRKQLSYRKGQFERVNTKTNMPRTIKPPDYLFDILLEEKKQQNKRLLLNKMNLVFTNYNNTPISYSQLNKGFNQIKHLIGNETITLHGLRHTCATLMLVAGESITNVQSYLGHAQLKTTLKYVHAMKEEQVAAINKVNRFLEALKNNKSIDEKTSFYSFNAYINKNKQ